MLASNSSLMQELVRKRGSQITKQLKKIRLTKCFTGSYTEITSGKVEKHTFPGSNVL